MKSLVLATALTARLTGPPVGGPVLAAPASLSAPLTLAPSLLAASFSPSLGPAPVAPALTPALAASVKAETPPLPSAPVPSGHVFVLAGVESKILGNTRPVAIYLPPGYETSGKRYPVLYMQDGQNAFDPETAFRGQDWGLARTADALIAAGEMEPVIIVAPYNTAARADEYTPVRDEGESAGGRGDDYGRFLSDELKPLVDRSLRTKPGPEDTALMGSSLGGLISLHLAVTRPDAFSRAGVLSPSLWWDEGWMAKTIRRLRLPKALPRLWVDMGTREGRPESHEANLENLRAMRETLIARGWVPGSDLETREIAGAGHSEAFWRERAGLVLRFLFPPKPVTAR